MKTNLLTSLLLFISLVVLRPSLFSASPLAAGQPLILGANNNESPTHLDPQLLKRTQTTWVRAFVPASHFLDGKTSLATDPHIAAFKKLGDLGFHLFVTIKWDLKHDYGNTSSRRVPAPDSAEEIRWFSFASQLLRTFEGHVSGLELVNELTVDTDPADLQAGPDGVAPMIRFLQRLAAHLTAERHLARDGAALPLYAGGFTRLDQRRMQENPVLASFMHWLSDSPLIFGVNFHLHQQSYEQFAASLTHIRRHVSKKPLAVTEFSLVWKCRAHLGETLSSGRNASSFCKTYGRSPNLTVADYLGGAAAQPVSQDEWHAFLATREWFDPTFLTTSTSLMAQNGVTLATYGFSHGSRKANARPRTFTTETTPWGLNMIFPFSWVRSQPDGSAPITYGLFDDWLAIQKRTATAGR